MRLRNVPKHIQKVCALFQLQNALLVQLKVGSILIYLVVVVAIFHGQQKQLEDHTFPSSKLSSYFLRIEINESINICAC